MITKLGTDVFGRDTIKNFENLGINLKHVLVTDEAPSGVAQITVDEDGNNSIVIVGGTNDKLTVFEIEAARETIRASDILLCKPWSFFFL